MLNRYISVGYVQSGTPHYYVPPHIVIPICGRFKSEHGERFHFLPLAKTNNLGVNIRQNIKLLISVQGGTNSPQVPWDFVGKLGENISLEEMNDVILERIEIKA